MSFEKYLEKIRLAGFPILRKPTEIQTALSKCIGVDPGTLNSYLLLPAYRPVKDYSKKAMALNVSGH